MGNVAACLGGSVAAYDDGYWKGYKDGSTDKKNKLLQLVEGFHFNHEWQAFEIKRALMKVLESEKG